MGSQQVQAGHSTPREAAEDRVNDKPVYPGHPPAPHAPSTLVNPSSPAKSARRAWHAPKATLLLLSAGDENGVRFPWAAHAVPIQAPLRARNKWG